MKKIPQRTCILCGDKINKKDLIRIVKNKDGEIFHDASGKANGRGAYICSKKECIDAIVKGNILNRTFKMEIEKEIKEKVSDDITKWKNKNS